MERYTKRGNLGIYGNDDEQILNTNQFDHNMEQIESFMLETDQKFDDEASARNEDKNELIKIIKVNKEAFDKHAANKSNPHNVTKEQLHIERVDNTNDLEKPISNAASEALNSLNNEISDHKLDKNNPHNVTAEQAGAYTKEATDEKVKEVNDSLTSHKNDKLNPHGVTKSQIGLGNVPNVVTNDQTPTYTEANDLSTLASGEKLNIAFGKLAKAVNTFITHNGNKANPHGVTKSQIGLGSVDNTSDKDKPVSTPQAAAIKTVQDSLDAHKNSKANPHAVTKSQVGLGNADNTSDANKPVSTAQAAAIKLVQDDLTSHKGNTSNPHTVTKAQVGLGNVPNVATNDQTPSYTAATTLTALVSGEKLSVAFGKLAKGITDLISHLANKSNPHGVTKAQIGLGSVDNTADKSKPVSTPQQDAIDAAMAQANAYTLQKIADLINGAPESMDTLKEVADAIAANENVMDALNAAIGTKAAQAELDGHTGNTTIHITATERSSWNGTVNAKHSHANKALLDTYTQTEANLKSAVDNKHSHSNKSVIDGITSALVTTWNGAVNVQHSHSNKALLDSYSQTEANLASAVSNRHTHSNKAVIDKITQAMLDTWDTVSGKAAAVHKHVKADITDFPASLKNPTALTLKLNGTAAATYDGSTAKEVNVTPAGIGAAASSHTHTKSQISDFTHTHDDRYYTESEIDAKVKTINDSISSKGGGDMLKSVYDANNDGTVDKAAAVPWSGVTGKPSTFTPSAHTHTKSQITDFPTSLPANGGTASYANYLNAIAIPEKADLNSYTTPGFYYCAANATVATLTNSPSTNAFFFIVGKHAGTFQMYVEYMSSGYKIFVRNLYSGTWGAWQRIYTTSNKPTLSELGAAASSHSHTKSQITDFPTSLPANGGNAATVGGFTVGVNVPAGAKFTDTVYTHPTSAGNKHIPSGGASGQILRWSADGTAVWGADNNTTYSAFKAATADTAGGTGLVPSPAAGKQSSFLRGDGQWIVPTNTTYSNMTAATASAAGKSGLVPAPAAGKQTSFLRGDGTWVVPANTTYGNMTGATSSAAGKAGLVPAPAAGAQAKFLRGDGTWQSTPNTTYGLATASASGLMPATDKAKVDKMRPENVIRNVTIATSAFLANTDDNATQYPYCADYTVGGMTATCWANVNLSAASKALGVIEQGNTMAGKLRLYANAVPSADIVIDNIVWKEVG